METRHPPAPAIVFGPRARRVAATAAVWVLFALPGCVAIAPGPRPRPGAAPPVVAEAAEAVPALVEAHNREREGRGLPPLVVNDRLRAAAQRHADDMAARRRMSHRGGDGSSPVRRMARAGYDYRSAGENVAAGQRSVGEVMAAWMRSPGHKRNVLGRFAEIGAGCATDAAGTPYWCVTFGTPSQWE